VRIRGESRGDAHPGWLGREVRLGPIVSRLTRRRTALVLALGVLLRVAQYLADRPPWLDEQSLAGVIEQKTFLGLFGPLSHAQLAPAGFLAVEWVLARTVGATPRALRAFPLLGGIASLFLFYGLARRCLRPRAAAIALGLFVVADDLIYFASELKQYSTDVAVGLACGLMGTSLAARPAPTRRLAAAAAAGAAAVWFSHPAVFVLAGLGAVLLASALARRAWREALHLGLLGLSWVASFAAVYAVSLAQLDHRPDMWAFWDFAFPPMPPSSLWDATWPVRRFLYLFVNPLNFDTPLGPRLSALPALGLFLAGCRSLWKRDRALFGMLTLPGLFALLASCLRLYPFHGRLVLFLVPSLLLLIAEGAGWLRETWGRGMLWSAVLGALFLFPSLGALYHLFEPRDRDTFNPYGDRRPAQLDPGRFPF
jgi:hypothetical protein